MHSGARILVAVPNALFRRELAGLLKGAGHDVVDTCRSLSDAAMMIEARAPDLIVCEPDLASSEGEQQLEALCAATPIPVICILVDQVRGDTAVEQGRRARAAGARDFVHRTARPGSSVGVGPILLRKLTQVRLPSARSIAQPSEHRM